MVYVPVEYYHLDIVFEQNGLFLFILFATIKQHKGPSKNDNQ